MLTIAHVYVVVNTSKNCIDSLGLGGRMKKSFVESCRIESYRIGIRYLHFFFIRDDK